MVSNKWFAPSPFNHDLVRGLKFPRPSNLFSFVITTIVSGMLKCFWVWRDWLMTSPLPGGHPVGGAPFTSSLICPPKRYPFIYSWLPAFEMLGQQELEWVRGAHPVLQLQPGLKTPAWQSSCRRPNHMSPRSSSPYDKPADFVAEFFAFLVTRFCKESCHVNGNALLCSQGSENSAIPVTIFSLLRELLNWVDYYFSFFSW